MCEFCGTGGRCAVCGLVTVATLPAENPGERHTITVAHAMGCTVIESKSASGGVKTMVVAGEHDNAADALEAAKAQKLDCKWN